MTMLKAQVNTLREEIGTIIPSQGSACSWHPKHQIRLQMLLTFKPTLIKDFIMGKIISINDFAKELT